ACSASPLSGARAPLPPCPGGGPRTTGLGLLPWSNCVHYDGEPGRRAEYLAGVEDGMTPGSGADDGAALHFVGSELDRVVSSRPGALAYRVEAVEGVARETPIQ